MEIDQLKTPLHKAVESGDIQAVQDLIQKGAKIDSQDKFNQTPLHCAAKGNHALIVDLLL